MLCIKSGSHFLNERNNIVCNMKVSRIFNFSRVDYRKTFHKCFFKKKTTKSIHICKLMKLKAIAYSYGTFKTLNNEYQNYQDSITD